MTMDTQSMKASELGAYMCVAHGGCLYEDRTIYSDGVWVRQASGGPFSSAHRDCYERWAASETPANSAYVAEYQHVRRGVLYRVVMPDPGPLGVIYVLADHDGRLTAETFRGRPLPDVPPVARAAVNEYPKIWEEES